MTVALLSLLGLFVPTAASLFRRAVSFEGSPARGPAVSRFSLRNGPSRVAHWTPEAHCSLFNGAPRPPPVRVVETTLFTDEWELLAAKIYELQDVLRMPSERSRGKDTPLMQSLPCSPITQSSSDTTEAGWLSPRSRAIRLTSRVVWAHLHLLIQRAPSEPGVGVVSPRVNPNL
jgi:hypothetical protein